MVRSSNHPDAGNGRNTASDDHQVPVAIRPEPPPEPGRAHPDQEDKALEGGRVRVETAAEGVEALQQERDDYYERLLRMTAEFDNYRKRIERERRDQAASASATLLQALLPIIDDLERALAAEAPAEAEPYRAGVDLVHRQMLDLLRRHGITPVEAVGTSFDPHVHEAVLTEPAVDCPDGQVTQELRRGYRLGDRLLRPAMVKVAKA